MEQEQQGKQRQGKPRRPHCRRALLGVAAGFGALLLLGWMGWTSLNTNPEIKVPTHVMPNPNARDFFLKAADALVDTNKINYALNRLHTGRNGDRPYSLAERVALVDENRGALGLLHRGFAYPYVEPPLRSVRQSDFRPMSRLRDLARFLRMVGGTRAAQGDWDGAMRAYLDAMQIGQMIPHGGAAISMLVGIAVTAIGAADAGKAVGQLNAAQARAAARRMETIIGMHVPFAAVLQEEEWTQQACLLDMFRDPGWHAKLRGLPMTTGADAGTRQTQLQQLKDALKFYLINKREVLYHYTRYMDQEIANARLPYAAHPPGPHLPDDPISQMVIFAGGRDHDVKIQAQLAQLCLRLAIQSYRMEHNTYPPTLNALVPAYLSRLPDDPYALAGSYGYVRDRTGYMLTSAAAR